MTIPTLLRHIGVTVPRYVTVAGQIVTDPQVSPTSFPPMAVQPHRFHGGDDPAPPRECYAGAWWNVDPDARAADEAAMQLHFPGFVQFGDSADLAYGGVIDTGRGRFEILVLPHVDKSLPTVVPCRNNLGRQTGRRIQQPDHVYLNGNLCVASTTDWLPDRHTTATAVGWAAHWFAAYTEWRMSGRWPTEGVDAVA
mgnify:FL=1|jgi:hypothetical protein